MDIPDRIHFFSHATGVSLELPVGFTEGDETATGVVYADHDDDTATDRALVIVTVAGPGVPGAERKAMEAMAGAADTVVGTDVREIDDESVALAELRYRSGLPGRSDAADGGAAVDGVLIAADVAVTFAAVVFAGALVTITAVTPWADRERFTPAFADAIDSCRFIAREAAA